MTRSIKKRIDLETEAGPASARGLPEPHAQHHVVLQGWQGQAGHGQFALAIIFLEISIDFPHDAGTSAAAQQQRAQKHGRAGSPVQDTTDALCQHTPAGI